MLVYKILIMEQNHIMNIDIFIFNKDTITTDIYHYCIGDIIYRRMLYYIKNNDYRLIYYLLRYYIIDNLTLQYDQECLICISTKEYTFNFTLDEIKYKTDSLYGR